jgi:hypothetical protein
MIIEIYKPYIKIDGSIEKVIENGFFIEWTPERIKNAFNFGNGTIKDFRRYMNDNKDRCLFLEV